MINLDTRAEGEMRQDYKFHLLIFSVFLLWFITFFSGLKAAASVWWVSEIFHHCAFVLPISAWLIYQKRHEIFAEAPKPNYFALPFIVLLMLIHIFGVAGDIQFFQYVATFGILPFIAWLFIGTKACSKIIFPLFFIGFAIPVGDELIPVLQEITADVSVFLLKLTGIPILRENLYIEIPNGRFFIAEACSGISFLIVSIVFGNLYAYLSFQKYKKKVLFLVLSFTVPIIANALRVFGIVLIGHYFGMEYATGTDHLVYGWVFYCFVLFLLIVIGEQLKDTVPISSSESNDSSSFGHIEKSFAFSMLLIGFLATSLWQQFLISYTTYNSSQLILPKNSKLLKNIQSIMPIQNKYPYFPGAEDSATFTIRDKYKIEVFASWYGVNENTGDLISSVNKLYNVRHFSQPEYSMLVLNYRNYEIPAQLTTLTSSLGSKKYILSWYQFEHHAFGQPWRAKMYKLKAILKNKYNGGGYVAITLTDQHLNFVSTKEQLGDLVEPFLDEIIEIFPFEKGAN